MNIFVLVTGLSLLSAQPYFPIPATMRIMIGSFQPVAKSDATYSMMMQGGGRRSESPPPTFSQIRSAIRRKTSADAGVITV